jgi:hypothetical protein
MRTPAPARVPGSDQADRAKYSPREERLPSIKGISGPYRFFFLSFDCREPKHVHVERDAATCKFWLQPVTLASNSGFGVRELNRIRSLIHEHLEEMTHAWDEHCGKR